MRIAQTAGTVHPHCFLQWISSPPGFAQSQFFVKGFWLMVPWLKSWCSCEHYFSSGQLHQMHLLSPAYLLTQVAGAGTEAKLVFKFSLDGKLSLDQLYHTGTAKYMWESQIKGLGDLPILSQGNTVMLINPKLVILLQDIGRKWTETSCNVCGNLC